MEELSKKVCDITAWRDEDGAITVKDGDKTWLIDPVNKQFLEFSDGEITSIDYKDKYNQVHNKSKKWWKLI